MGLPRWIAEDWSPFRGTVKGTVSTAPCQTCARYKEALSIAWEALEIISSCPTSVVGHAKNAALESMRRIEEMGK
jgi:hypothetical protein